MRGRLRLLILALMAAFRSVTVAGVPGSGYIVDALSDEFENQWSFDYANNTSSNGLWYATFRGAPEQMALVASPEGAVGGSAQALQIRSVDNGDDAYPGMEDLVARLYDNTVVGHFLAHSEGPSVVGWVYLPPISLWPVGTHSFGFRAAARDSTLISASNPLGEYYPSLWTYRANDGKGYLMIRVGDGFTPDFLVAEFTSGGWYTFGISWNALGQTEYYAAAGRVTLASGDLFYTDSGSGRVMEVLAYHFFSLRFPADGSLSPDFLVDRCRVFTSVEPIPPSIQLAFPSPLEVSLATAGGTPGFAYRIERSFDLSPGSWQTVAEFLNDGGTSLRLEEPAFNTGFFRLAR